MSQKAGLLKIQITSIMHRKFSKTLVLNLLVKESAIYVLGSNEFKSEYVREKIINWTPETKLNRVLKNTTVCCIRNLLQRSSPQMHIFYENDTRYK